MGERATVTDGWAVAGGRLRSRVVDVTDDPAARDSSGFRVLVMTFEGAAMCPVRGLRPAR
jgi:hypothetical protein